MAITEGTPAMPTDVNGVKQAGLYDLTNFWHPRSNLAAQTLLASAARTTQQQVTGPVNHNWRGAYFIVNVSAGGGAGGLTFYVRETNASIQLLVADAAITTTGTYVYLLYPGAAKHATPGSHLVKAVSGPLPRDYEILITVADGTSYTYTVKMLPII